MEELFEEAASEFKRADHLFYVSLKYSRTGDVIMSLIDRLISCIDKSMDVLFKFKEIKEIPPAPLPRANLIKQNFAEDKLIIKTMDLFFTMRKMIRSEKEASNEFRRTLKVTIEMPDEDEPFILDIDTAQIYYDLVKKYLQHIKEMISND
ncbi:MAG: hypothetical protein U9R34_01770 [Nanoarchaeota archaeon]|nr:hypothetical protein [Nanoarchaeota archaeon]